MTELTKKDKLALVGLWRKEDRNESLLYFGLFLLGIAATLALPKLPQLDVYRETELIKALLGASLLGTGKQAWQRWRWVQRLTFVEYALLNDQALAHAAKVFESRLRISEGI